MVFSSSVFLFLFLPALLVCYFLPVGTAIRRKWRNGVLLLFSIGFYAWGEPVFVFVMLFSVLVNWFLALMMSRSVTRRKAWLTAAILLDALLLFVFKYVSFLSENLSKLTGNAALTVSIALPIGISFFTFQMMSYVFDVYYGTAAVQKNPLYVALYITLFPQLIAGPIVRYTDVAESITEREESFSGFSAGIRRFLYGLGKKVLLANFLAQIADNIFDAVPSPSVLLAWLGAAAYSLQIYYDFSGYSDMAIGLGLVFGFRFPENFNYPYCARSVTDFWRRWHISLSTWFRDYVYIPLGGSRVNKARWIRNLFAVWLLTGIWHGANLTFVVWGLVYFAVLLAEKLTGRANGGSPLTRVYTLLTVLLAWVIFRSADLPAGIAYLGNMFGFGSGVFAGDAFFSTLRRTWPVLLLALIGSTPLVRSAFEKLPRRLKWIEGAWLCAVFVLSVIEVVGTSYNPFIYFNF